MPTDRKNLVTVIVIGLGLAILLFLGLFPIKRHGHILTFEKMARTRLMSLQFALQSYRWDYGLYPPGPNPDMTRALTSASGAGPYIDPKGWRTNTSGQLIDPWGTPYIYLPQPEGKSYRLYSCGINGLDEGGSGDDILEEAKIEDPPGQPE